MIQFKYSFNYLIKQIVNEDLKLEIIKHVFYVKIIAGIKKKFTPKMHFSKEKKFVYSNQKKNCYFQLQRESVC